MNKLGKIPVGNGNPVRVMGILNASPESFYKESVKTTNSQIRDAVIQMESDGADFVDVGGMSTAPYLSYMVSEKVESERILAAINIIQSCSNLPISVDTCRGTVAKAALENGVEIINDISGMKFDKNMRDIVSKFRPSLILCAYGNVVKNDPIEVVYDLLMDSIDIAKECNVSLNQIVVDPAIGFFRQSGMGNLFSKIDSDWADRDISIIQNLNSIKLHPLLVSVSNKSFLSKITGKEKPEDRLFGSIAVEVVAVMNGADIIRTHNVSYSKDAIAVALKFKHKSL